MDIWTLGHSTRDFEVFLALLQQNDIALLADVRRYPGSRRYPHFSREALAQALPSSSIRYIHMPALGGRRQPAHDSLNTAWRNDQFRAYADYMATPEFADAVDALVAHEGRMAIVCAEAVPWRCHRNLVSDELVRRGIRVQHILGPQSLREHVMNPMALEAGGHLVYPAPQRSL